MGLGGDMGGERGVEIDLGWRQGRWVVAERGGR